MQDKSLLAAIDLGSNSFRLQIGRVRAEQLEHLEYLKETVKQGTGMDEHRHLSPESMQRGWDCLARFAERLADFKPKQVRAVATQTLREARNKDQFLQKAQAILGFPIDVISGKEEARLIYLGVSNLLPQSEEKRLVIDIGGRSTELIIGQGYTAQTLESYRVGSAAWSLKYFEAGQIRESAFLRAETAAKAILDEGIQLFAKRHWDISYGSSGTVNAVADILAELGFAPKEITRVGLHHLKNTLIQAGHIDRVKFSSLREDRRSVLCGGLAVLIALFDLFDIDHLIAAEGALRHGVLYDLLDRRLDATDMRRKTVRRMMQMYGVDTAQSLRVRNVSLHLFSQITPVESEIDYSRLSRKLGWAADLHEIGSHISHSDYHKHGAYILDSAEAMGFAAHEMHRLSLLILGQKGKLRKLGEALNDCYLTEQLLCLRLGLIACHARNTVDWQQVELSKKGSQFNLTIPGVWQLRYPQSVHLLLQEVSAWSKTPWQFKLNQV